MKQDNSVTSSPKPQFSDWLTCVLRDPSSYENFHLYDYNEKGPIHLEMKKHLLSLLVEARLDPDLINASVEYLGWEKVKKFLVAPIQPTRINMRRGEFGEILMSELLTNFFNYYIPVPKHRFIITPNQSLPGTDVIAIKKDNSRLTDVCFVESKLRTTCDVSAAVRGYEQLESDYTKRVPDMIRFVLNRLSEKKDPFFPVFLEYMCRREDMRDIERYVLGLVWDCEVWSETVLENLENELNDTHLPEFTVHVIQIGELVTLTNELFLEIGVKEILDNE